MILKKIPSLRLEPAFYCCWGGGGQVGGEVKSDTYFMQAGIYAKGGGHLWNGSLV